MRRKRAVRIVVYSLTALLLIAIGTGGYLWVSVQRTMNAMYEPLPSLKWVDPVFETERETESRQTPEPKETETAPAVPSSGSEEKPNDSPKLDEQAVARLRHPSLENREPFSMLLLGVDERAGDRGRSDTMILLTVHPRSGKAIALSIPRDTRVRMPNSDKNDKINHAYAFGGTSLAVEAVEQAFGVPIAYYMKTNMEGLVSIVDTLGGVDVSNEQAFEYEGFAFPVGEQHLNGEKALAYSRMRKLDPRGDIGRTSRQRQVLSGAIDRVTSGSSIVKLPKLLSRLSEYVRTNLTSDEMIDLATNYHSAIRNVDTLYLQGQGQTIGGIYYYTITAEERRRIQAEMLKALDEI